MGFNPFSGRGLVGLGTLGLSEVLGENTMSKVPVLNSIGGYQSDAQKALVKKQEQLAAEAEEQRKRNQQMRMQALGQSLLAFNPQNQMMAQMFGPQAAFSPQQFAQMANDPGARSPEQFAAAREQAMPKFGDPIDPKTRTRQGGTIEGWSQEDVERMRQNEARKRAIEAQMTPLGPGPAPLNLPAPAAARRY